MLSIHEDVGILLETRLRGYTNLQCPRDWHIEKVCCGNLDCHCATSVKYFVGGVKE
jgi:hypothetical protein